jgi:predicted 2-oxoglutarate/Fe(II)-dependent dioxygenase YbiX
MSGRSRYDGGGTFFADTGEAANADAGGVISFDGSLMHSGHPITAGVRYILVAFLYSHSGADTDDDSAAAGAKRKAAEMS